VSDGVHVMHRGPNRHASLLARIIIANGDGQPVTAYDIAARTPSGALSERVRSVLRDSSQAVDRRLGAYRTWQAEAQSLHQAMDEARARRTSQSRDCGIEM
jgi:hypothetical protein